MANYRLYGEGKYRYKFRWLFIDLGWREVPLEIKPINVTEPTFEKDYFFYNGTIRLKVAVKDGRLDFEVYLLGQQVLNWEKVLIEGNVTQEVPFMIKPWKGVELSGKLTFQRTVA